MIDFEKFEVSKCLKVIVHQDKTTPIVAFNILYDIGARDESEDKTGFAHLFEHLMFGGSEHIPDFDGPLQLAGGQSNAFTSNDITNYYCTIPKQNMETAFWLDSDRLNQLAFTPKSLEVQRSVVIEEFKQRYLNQPYGDVWLLLRPMMYKTHPYKWATIGKKIEHIEDATMDDVKSFFYNYYSPSNAVLCVAGDVSRREVEELSEKWFGPIPNREVKTRNLPIEHASGKREFLEVERDVPADALYMAFRMSDRKSPEYYVADVLSDVLSRGKSSRFHKELIKGQEKFTELAAYILGSMDEGLFVITGKPAEGVSLDEAESAVYETINKLFAEGIEEKELY